MSRTSPRRAVGAQSRSLLYVLPIAAQAVITLASLPIMIRAAGAEGWAQIAVGQSIGAIGSVLLSLGWGITGPALVALADDHGRRLALAGSLVSKGVLALPVAAVVLLVGALIEGGLSHLSALGSLVVLSFSLACTWYFVGVADPVGLVLLDALPRLAVTALGWVAVAAGAPVEWGLLGQLLASLLAAAVVWSARAGWTRSILEHVLRWRSIAATVRQQAGGLTVEVVPALFNYTPVVAVSLVDPAAVPLLALVDRVQKQLVSGLVPVGNIVIARTSERLATEGPTRATTSRSGLRRTALIGLAGGVGTLVIGSTLVHLLSGGTSRPPFVLVVAMSAVVACAFVAAVLPAAALAPLAAMRDATTAAVVGAAVGLVCTVSGALWLGALGAELGLLAGFGVIVACQAWRVVVRSRA